MKKLIIVVLFVGLLSACVDSKDKMILGYKYVDGDALDKKVLKDGSGNVYMLEHMSGDAYFIQKLDTTEINEITKVLK